MSVSYKAIPRERQRLERFIQTGIFVGLATNTEINILMNNIHQYIFGETIKERKENEYSLWQDEEIDYSQDEQPSFDAMLKIKIMADDVFSVM